MFILLFFPLVALNPPCYLIFFLYLGERKKERKERRKRHTLVIVSYYLCLRDFAFPSVIKLNCISLALDSPRTTINNKMIHILWGLSQALCLCSVCAWPHHHNPVCPFNTYITSIVIQLLNAYHVVAFPTCFISSYNEIRNTLGFIFILFSLMYSFV